MFRQGFVGLGVAAAMIVALVTGVGGAGAQQPYCPAGAKASGARVQLWADANCRGGSMIIGTSGNGDRSDFRFFKNVDGRVYNVNDTRSSLAVAPHTCARVFEHINYAGLQSNILCAKTATAYFGLIKFNDLASSMRVCRDDRQYQCSRTGTSGATAPPAASPTPNPQPGPAPAPSSTPPPSTNGNGKPVDALRWDTPRSCSKGPQPGAYALRDWLKANIPGHSDGIFNCRSVRGRSNLSLHAEGRAIDWNVSKSVGDKLVARLLASEGNQRWALARRMGLQEVIWYRHIWTARRASEGWRPYSGVNPHTEHVHLGMNWAGALKRTSFWG